MQAQQPASILHGIFPNLNVLTKSFEKQQQSYAVHLAVWLASLRRLRNYLHIPPHFWYQLPLRKTDCKFTHSVVHHRMPSSQARSLGNEGHLLGVSSFKHDAGEAFLRKPGLSRCNDIPFEWDPCLKTTGCWYPPLSPESALPHPPYSRIWSA